MLSWKDPGVKEKILFGVCAAFLLITAGYFIFLCTLDSLADSAGKFIVQDSDTRQAEFHAAVAASRRTVIAVGAIGLLFLAGVALMLFRCIPDPGRNRCPLPRGNEDGALSREGDEPYAGAARHPAPGQLPGLLRELHEHPGNALEGVRVPCTIFSPEDTVLYTNRLMLDLLEIDGSPDDVLGQSSGQYIREKSGEETLATRALREDRPLCAQLEFRTRKGAVGHAVVAAAPFHDREGKVLGALSTWIDITAVVEKQRNIEQTALRRAEAASARWPQRFGDAGFAGDIRRHGGDEQEYRGPGGAAC